MQELRLLIPIAVTALATAAIIAACHNDVPGPTLPTPLTPEVSPQGPRPGPITPTPVRVDQDAGVPLPLPPEPRSARRAQLRSSALAFVERAADLPDPVAPGTEEPDDAGAEEPEDAGADAPIDAPTEELADAGAPSPDADDTTPPETPPESPVDADVGDLPPVPDADLGDLPLGPGRAR